MATKNILERLEFWGLELRDDGTHGDHEWVLTGLADDDWIDYDPTLTQPQALMLLSGELDSYTLSKETLETRLDWRGYHPDRDSGWAINVKLHKVYDYMRAWDFLTDDFEEREVPYWIQESNVESDYEFFKETVPSPLDSNAFHLAGRSGGWLMYGREVLAVDEADALVEVYEKIPILVDNLCQEIATKSVAWMCGEEWGMEYETESATAFSLYSNNKPTLRMEITYGS